LGMVVVIPCFNEPDLVGSLEALRACARPDCAVEVITVVNAGVQHPAHIHERNALTLAHAREWAATHNEATLQFHFLEFPALPKKHAGVGLARKIGMDEAVHRLALVDRHEAPIVCFDADAGCRPNYLRAIETHFRELPKTPACSIFYAHPLEGPEVPDVYAAITRYELYLRYYVLALRQAGHPHAFHTIGSSMAVRSAAYQAQGGMNRRKAGEDFHFLQKLIPLGHFSELKTTAVLPSPRISDRVPFGTGKAIGDWVADPKLDYPVYALRSFQLLGEFISALDAMLATDTRDFAALLEHAPKEVAAYLNHIDFAENIRQIASNTTNAAMFRKRFFRWFNGLKVLQYFHFVRDEFLANVPVAEASAALLEWMGEAVPTSDSDLHKALLECFREIEQR
ncbi:MAG: glycosyltransferase family 2 protein, partial [Bacteroidota bacterium]